MSLKSLLMPVLSQRFLSRERLLQLRERAERTRLRRGARHQVHYFHQVDDPYSALAAAALPGLLANYDIELIAHVVPPPADAAAPERRKLIAYSRKDTQLLARHYGLAFSDPMAQPSQQAVTTAEGILVAAAEEGCFADMAGPLSASLWQLQNEPEDLLSSERFMPMAKPGQVATHLQASDALRQKLGHYLGATFYYAGEWYWGIDRLHYLEQRLQELQAQRSLLAEPLFAPPADLQEPVPHVVPAAIDFFFSLRSPYSAIAAARVFELGRLTGATVNLRFVLPMVMRGLPVPRAKRVYISRDTAREAWRRQIPFGRLNDPVGRPVERGLALIPYAENLGLGQAFVLSFLRGVWAEGIDAGSERGLRTIVERAGLNWAAALGALRDPGWRKTAEINRTELLNLGLWGVPSFRVDDTAVWGQDRLWAVADALRRKNQAPPAAYLSSEGLACSPC